MVSNAVNRHALVGSIAGLAATLAVTWIFRQTSLDVELQSLAFGESAISRWPHANRPTWKLLHDYGTIPGLLFALGAIAGATASFVDLRAQRWRYPALYVVALTALGPGLVTNIIGKIFAGRPRPEEIRQFGGSLEFLRPFDFGTPGRGFSFLCGHCSMGFLFFALFFLPGFRRPWTALLATTAFGLLLGVARVADGAHFPSDVLLEATIMFTLAAALSPLAWKTPGAKRVRSRVPLFAGGIVATLLIAAFLVSLPINKERITTWIDQPSRAPATREVFLPWKNPSTMHIDVERGDVAISFAPRREAVTIYSVVRGFGFPGAGGKSTVTRSREAITYRHRLDGFLWEARPAFEVVIDSETTLRRVIVSTVGSLNVDRRESPSALTILRRVRETGRGGSTQLHDGLEDDQSLANVEARIGFEGGGAQSFGAASDRRQLGKSKRAGQAGDAVKQPHGLIERLRLIERAHRGGQLFDPTMKAGQKSGTKQSEIRLDVDVHHDQTAIPAGTSPPRRRLAPSREENVARIS
jgi:membrane-associated PAP2 superfamily phosphatase